MLSVNLNLIVGQLIFTLLLYIIMGNWIIFIYNDIKQLLDIIIYNYIICFIN